MHAWLPALPCAVLVCAVLLMRDLRDLTPAVCFLPACASTAGKSLDRSVVQRIQRFSQAGLFKRLILQVGVGMQGMRCWLDLAACS